MFGRLVRWFCALVLALAFALANPASAQPASEADKLTAQVILLYQAGKYAEAIPLAQRALELREKALGPEHPDVATPLRTLGELYLKQGRYAEAEPLFRRSLDIRERDFGPEHVLVAQTLNSLGDLQYWQTRLDAAEHYYRRSLAIREKALGPDHPDVAMNLVNIAQVYKGQGRYAEAEPILRRGLLIYEKALGSGHHDYAIALGNLAGLLMDLGRYSDAEPLLKKALAIREKALGPEHPEVASAFESLAVLYTHQGRYAEAEPMFQKGLVIRQKALGANNPDVARSLGNLASLYQDQGRFAEAESYHKRSLAIREIALGPNHADVGRSLSNLTSLYTELGRYAEAETSGKRSLAIREKELPADHPDIATSLNNLAQVYEAQGRNVDAEPLLRRSLTIYTRAFGEDHPAVAHGLNNLASLLEDFGRYADAEPLFKRSLAIREKAFGPDHLDVANSLNNLSNLYSLRQQYADAERLLERCLAIREKALGPGHPLVATTLSNLAVLYTEQGRFEEAWQLFERITEIREKALPRLHPDVASTLDQAAMILYEWKLYSEAERFLQGVLELREELLGSEHPDVGQSLNNLALVYAAQGRHDEAEALHKRGLSIYEKVFGPEHPRVAVLLHNLATLSLTRGESLHAAELWRRSTSILQRRTERSFASGKDGSAKGEAWRSRWQFAGLVKATYRLPASDSMEVKTRAAAMFETAQWALASEAAVSLAKMAARSATSDAALRPLVREQQDLLAEWQNTDKRLIVAKSAVPANRNPENEKRLADRLVAIDLRLSAIDQRFASEFPDYAKLVIPHPVSISEVQSQIRDDEALVLFLDTAWIGSVAEETFIWVVTKSQVRWVRTVAGMQALADYVAALRCGLDAAAWAADDGARCRSLLQADKNPAQDEPLPFSAAIANELYEELFGQVEDLIKGKHLLIVPSGALARLPFQALVVSPPDGDDLKGVRWLAREHAITVLPAVSSLQALRRVSKPSQATLPMIGFGNPLLDGQQWEPRLGDYYKALAALARDLQSCPESAMQQTTMLRGLRSIVSPVPQPGGIADLKHIRMQTPLPQTVDELCAVARNLKSDVGEIRLGARATETEVKKLSASGALARYRVVHFSTHGALAGEVRKVDEPGQRMTAPGAGRARDYDYLGEPGLIMTPPETASTDDDGYLSASEIASFKLDADWVILSACNTAGGEGKDERSEALSGLARAFFYAQARALLVSHWAVETNATVKLITTAVEEATRDAKVGRAEALRRAMLTLIDKGEPHEKHPTFWAPFVLVGEGGAGR